LTHAPENRDCELLVLVHKTNLMRLEGGYVLFDLFALRSAPIDGVEQEVMVVIETGN